VPLSLRRADGPPVSAQEEPVPYFPHVAEYKEAPLILSSFYSEEMHF
jgi:hypothetical protein